MSDPIRGKWLKAYSNFDDWTQEIAPLSFGIRFLDKATRGIYPDDLILVGAPTGSGKTQFCMNLALANVKQGKKVHFIALEASKDEIQKRLAYSLYADLFYSDPQRPVLRKHLNFADFVTGSLKGFLEKYDDVVLTELAKLEGLNIHYGGHDFSVKDLIKRVVGVAGETDLIIVDHVHYFDFETNQTENEALKAIAKTARRLTQEIIKPIILIAHLRKRDRFNKDLVPSIDEFHGSSDLTKIATKVLTLAPGEMSSSTTVESFVRIVKNRYDGSVKNYVGKLIFDFKRGNYRPEFVVGEIIQDDKTKKQTFNTIREQDEKYPYWLN